MNTRRSILSIFTAGLALLVTAGLLGSAAQAASQADAKAKIGEAAPNFTLPSAEGKEISLSDYEGKIVVLEWINPDCPVCRRVFSTGVIKDTVANAKKMDSDLVYLAINSTHYMPAEKTAKYLKKHEVDIPALIDTDGTVGKMYGAKTTPHLFVIDAEGILRYNGAIDDDNSGGAKRRAGDPVTNYVINTITQIKAGETVSPDKTRSYGCSVKYAK